MESTMRIRSRFLSLLAALLIPSVTSGAPEKAAPKPETQVREEARVTVVEVPVNVVDKNGRAVENLTADDFEIFDDGKKQPLTGFEVLDERQPLPMPKTGDSPINPAARRHFLLLFDLAFGSPRGIVNARQAARDFVVTRMKELDLAAVATYSTENGLRLLVTFTSDRTQLASAIDTLGFPGLGERNSDPLSLVIIEPSQSNSSGFSYLRSTGSAATQNDIVLQDALENMEVMRARSQRAIYRDRVTRLLESFASMARALDAVPGRKHILYLSEGFDSRELSGSTSDGGGAKEAESIISGQPWKVDSDSRFGNSGLQAKMGSALTLFNRSDCVIHAIDIGGLRAPSDVSGSANNNVNGQEALFYFADQTGGEFLKNANDLGNSFDRLLDRTGLIYILAFQPVRIPENGKFHALRVRVKNRSHKVSARTGYYEPRRRSQVTALERKLATSSAIAAAVPQTEIPAWVLAAPFPGSGGGPARVPVIVEIPGDRLLAKHKDPVMNLDLYIYAVDASGETRDYVYQPIGLDLAKVRDSLSKSGIKFYAELNLPPGEYTLRTLVLDNESDRTGLTLTSLTVPAEGREAPFAAPPIFLAEGRAWIMVKGKPRHNDDPRPTYPFAFGGEAFVPAAFASLRSGDTAQVCMIAYNFPSAASTISYAGRALGIDGRAHGKVDLKLLRASDHEGQGERKLLLQFRPSGLDPGRYALAVRLLDPKTGKSSESSFPFDVF
jgi:VWFA-related protein